MIMDIVCMNFHVFGYGPSLIIWVWDPRLADYQFEIHWRYLSWQIGRVEIDMQWL
jgi:hypothetical protein